MNASFSVLICDASDIVRHGVALVAGEMSNCTVVGYAGTGTATVENTLQLAPDLVVMDIGLTDMDGITALRTIKESNSKTKLLVLTELEDDPTIVQTVVHGADSFCLKNRPINLLKHAMEATLNGACWLDPGVGMRMVRSAGLTHSMKSTHTRLVRLNGMDDKFRLSPREYDVLKLLVEGLSNKDIAARLWISMETVKSHVSHIMEKLEVSDRTQAALKALREKIV